MSLIYSKSRELLPRDSKMRTRAGLRLVDSHCLPTEDGRLPWLIDLAGSCAHYLALTHTHTHLRPSAAAHAAAHLGSW